MIHLDRISVYKNIFRRTSKESFVLVVTLITLSYGNDISIRLWVFFWFSLKECFTRVLKGHIALAQAVFPNKTTGENDPLCTSPVSSSV